MRFARCAAMAVLAASAALLGLQESAKDAPPAYAYELDRPNLRWCDGGPGVYRFDTSLANLQGIPALRKPRT